MKFKIILLTLLISIPSVVYPWGWPTDSKFITSDFGPRMRKSWDFHEGIDIRAAIGTDVYAVEDGEFTWIDGTYGTAQVEHKDKVVSRYLHCSKALKKSGDEVKKGDKIALSGEKGSEGSPHLHFDFNNKPNWPHPLRYLPYDNTSDPTVNRFETPNDGDTVSGVIDVKVNVLSTTDKDLNSFELQCNGNRIGYISYDPRTNCNSNTCIPNVSNGLGNDTFVISWDTTTVEDGEYTLTGIATDAGGKEGRKEIKVSVQNAQITVKIDPVKHTFDQPNQSKTHKITIENKSDKEEYKGELILTKTRGSSCLSVTKEPEKSLTLPAKGKVETTMEVKSGSEIKKDDDLIHEIELKIPNVPPEKIKYPNGKAITDHPVVTGNLIVTISPVKQDFTEPGQSKSHTIKIENKTDKSVTTNIAMTVKKPSSCLSVTKQPDSSLNIPAKGERSTEFTVTSKDPLVENDDLIHEFTVTAEGVKPEDISYPNGRETTDHPEGDTTPPQVKSTDPKDGEVDVPLDKVITVILEDPKVNDYASGIDPDSLRSDQCRIVLQSLAPGVPNVKPSPSPHLNS